MATAVEAESIPYAKICEQGVLPKKKNQHIIMFVQANAQAVRASSPKVQAFSSSIITAAHQTGG